MAKSCAIGSSSIRDTIQATLGLHSEAEAFATVDYHCRMKGTINCLQISNNLEIFKAKVPTNFYRSGNRNLLKDRF